MRCLDSLQDPSTGVAEAAAAGVKRLVQQLPEAVHCLVDVSHPVCQKLQQLGASDKAVLRQRVLALLAAVAANTSGQDAVLARDSGKILIMGPQGLSYMA